MSAWFSNRKPDKQEDAAPTAKAPLPLTGLEESLTRDLLEYGRTNDGSLVGNLDALYHRVMHEVPAERRLQLLLFIIDLVEKRSISPNAFMPFIFRDTDSRIVATAALHAAGTYPGSEHDPIAGVRELAGYARDAVDRGDEARAAAILVGLVDLGDRRVLACLGPCWREFSPQGRKTLAEGIAGRHYGGVIDWLVTWLEECEGGEFGAVAGAIASIQRVRQPPEVIDVRRAMPVWSAEGEHVIAVVARWSVEGYADVIRPRLLQIAADEQPPRVMHDVLKEWRIDHTRRLMAGVALRPRPATHPARPLVPLLGAASAGATGISEKLILLEDDDFLDRDGRILLSWSIFNPYGPTWSCLGLIPTEDPAVQYLFYRMLNPFAQESGIVGVAKGDDCRSGTALGEMVAMLFSRESVDVIGGGTIEVIGGGAPDLVQVLWDEPQFYQLARRAICSAPRLRELDLTRDVRELQEFRGRPWDRASAQMHAAAARIDKDGQASLPEREGWTKDATIDQWWEAVTNPEHWAAMLYNFPAAWHGAIDNVGSELSQRAYTFWQLDDFLARYGYREFRNLAEVVTEYERRAGADAERPEESSASSSATLPGPDEADSSYAEAYRRFQRWVAGANEDDASILECALAIGGGVIGSQVVRAEQELGASKIATEQLRGLMRTPWALGYLIGVAFGMIERFEIPRDSQVAQTVIQEIHFLGLGASAIQTIATMSKAASQEPEFEQGMILGGKEVSDFANGDAAPTGSRDWIRAQV